jgi:hypothetical protein
MGYFTIDLPGNIQAEVRFGMVTKKTGLISLFDLFRKGKIKPEKKKGYFVKTGEGQLYRFLRTKNGEWLKEDDSGFLIATDDETTRAIKKAIEEHEQSPHH